MSSESPWPPLDLLVIGALTVDRFADGSSAPGGSVLHICRAAARRGLRIGVVTVAGPEPEAEAGLDELRNLAAQVGVTQHDATWTFSHRESPDGRTLFLDRLGGTVAVPAETERFRASARLYAPVANELSASVVSTTPNEQRAGAILQGWLRTTDEGAEASPVPLQSLQESLREALAALAVLVASSEDLSATAERAIDQLSELRTWAGTAPSLVVTEGPRGLWLDSGGSAGDAIRERVPAPWVVDAADTVGAGDVLAAMLTMSSVGASGVSVTGAQHAMRVVAEELELRTS